MHQPDHKKIPEMKFVLIVLFVMLTAPCFSQQEFATAREYKMFFPTYPFSDPNPIPLLTPVFPYFRFDGFTDKPIQKEWKVVELENSYIKLLILPEIGGKIWAAIEKSTNRPFLYYNHTVKFRDIAMRGPWTSGGLEANYGIIGHTPNCATPVDYITRTNADGSVSCIIGTLDLLTRTHWRMEINVPKDKAYFTTQSFWYNTTGTEQPYYHWMNAGLKAKGNLEFIYPGTKYLGHEGEYAEWPVNQKNGKQINFYENNDFGGYKSYHVFGKYTDFTGAYYHDDDMGMVRYGPHDDKAGKKIWIWGLSRQGMIWEKLLTDADGQYVELQSGRLFNQSAEKSTFTPFKHISFKPAQTDTWKEFWYPVLRTNGIVYANELGALNIYADKGWLKIRFCPVEFINANLKIQVKDSLIHSSSLQLKPLQVFQDSIRYAGDLSELTATIGEHQLTWNGNPDATVLSRPVDSPVDFDWNSIYGLYLQGEEGMDQKLYPLAEEKLRSCLQKDHNYLPALVKLSELCYRNMRYTEGLELAKRALSIDTYDGSANYIYALHNLQLGHRMDARDGFDIATLSPEIRSMAYAGISRMYMQDGNLGMKNGYTRDASYDKAIVYAQKAIDFNRYNMDALLLEAVAYRQLNKQDRAAEVLTTIEGFDPLNHFAHFEGYRCDSLPANKDRFISLIRNELPQETYIEMAIWYANIGLKEEAMELFRSCPPNAEAAYWLAYLQNKPVDFNAVHPEFSFPFRSESAEVIESLLAKQDEWLLKYQLALIYKDRNRIDESKKLLASCGNEPGFAPFYAVRAAINGANDEKGAEADFKKALSLDSQWRYNKLLAEFYIIHQQPEKALPVTEAFYHSHPESYIMGMLYARVLLLNGKYSTADAVLTKLQVIPFEGATYGHELYREAKLMQALQQMEKKNCKAAKTFINQALEWPENLGVGKPYDENIDTRLENWMNYQCYIQQKDKVKAEAMLHEIVDFHPVTENTVSNFYPSNALLTAWAYDKLGQHERAQEWLTKQERADPGNKTIAWCRSVFEGKPVAPLIGTERDVNLQLLEEMMKHVK